MFVVWVQELQQGILGFEGGSGSGADVGAEEEVSKER